MSEREGQPPRKVKAQQMTLRVPGDLLDWWRDKGRGYQTQMIAALREPMQREQERDAHG